MDETAAEVVISGIACRLPESDNIAEFRDHLMNGEDMVTENDSRFQPGMYGTPKRFGKIKDLSKFDAYFFGLHPKQTDRMDPQIRIMMEVVYEAIVDAGVNPQSIRGSKTGVFVSQSQSESYVAWTEDVENVSGYEMIGCILSMAANRLSYFFDFRGPSLAVDTACATGLYLIDHAVRSIRSGQCDAAVVAAANTILHPRSCLNFRNAGVLSPDGTSKAFDASVNGYCRGEGILAVYIQKKEEANRIHATWVNSLTSADGYKKHGILYPSGDMQRKLFRDVYSEARVDPSDVSFVELNGTGTPVGDVQETNSVADVFCRNGRSGPLLIGSVKSNMGHSEISSGLSSLAKVIIAMHDRAIPPNLHFNEPNPDIPGLFDGRLKVVTERTPWEGGYAAINSFTIVGGSNAHLLIKSSDIVNPSHVAATAARLVTCSGRTQEAVEAMLAEVLQHPTDVEMQYLLQNSVGDTPPTLHPYRGVTVVNSATSQQMVEKVSSEARPVWFVFSGMGAQWPNMGRDLMTLDCFRESIMRSDALMKPYGIQLYDILTNSTDDAFKSNINSAVGIVAIQVALVDVLRTLGIEPDGIVGHSVGEISCAYADGCLTAEEAVLNVYWRSRCTSEANLPSGGMAAVGLTWKEAHDRCPEGVVPACHNSADTVTVSGPADSVAKFVAELQKEGVFARAVDSCGVAFHSYFMNQVAPALKQRLQQVIRENRPRTKRWISSSVPQSQWQTDQARYSSPDYYVHNMVSPVLFQEALKHVPKNAVVVEVAPHSLMLPVLRRALASNCTAVGLMDKRQPDNHIQLLNSLGKLYTNGVNLNSLALYPPVQLPVSSSTPWLSPLIRWDHAVSWALPTGVEHIAAGSGGGSAVTVEVNMGAPDSKDAYLSGHMLDGRTLFPATGYLVLAWRQLAKMHGKTCEETPVSFDDVHIYRATILPSNGTVKLGVTVSPGSGDFEICEHDSVVASGRIAILEEPEIPDNEGPKPVETTEPLPLNSEDIYKELRLRGYEYGPTFQGVLSADGTGTEGLLVWNDNWVTFLDTMLQMQIIASARKELRLPTRIRSVRVDPVGHEKFITTLEDGTKVVRVTNNRQMGTCKAGGVEVVDLHAAVTPRRQGTQTPTLDRGHFFPYYECAIAASELATSVVEYAQTCASFVLEKMNQLLLSNVEDGLQNLKLMQRLVGDSSWSPVVSEKLSQYLDSPDCVGLKTLEKIFAIDHDGAFAQNVDSLVSTRWADIVSDDRLFSFARRDRCFKTCLDVAIENTPAAGSYRHIKCVECDAGTGQAYRHAMPQFLKEGGVIPTYVAMDPTPAESIDEEVVQQFGITTVEWSLKSTKPVPDQAAKADLVVLANVLSRYDNISSALSAASSVVRDNGFLLIVEPTSNFAIPWSFFALTHDVTKMSDLDLRTCGPFCDEQTWNELLTNAGLTTVAQKSDGVLHTVFLCRKLSSTSQPQFPKIIDVDDASFSWLEEIKAVMGEERSESDGNCSVWLKSSKADSGIAGMLNCLRREPNGDRLRYLFLSEVTGGDPSILPTAEQLLEIYRKDLTMNVFRNGVYGTFRYLPLLSGGQQHEIQTDTAYVNVLTRGDLSSLHWIESPLKYFDPAEHPDQQLCRVHYAALNFRDIMLATGKLPPDAIPGELASQDCLLGMEFSGHDETGKRVMGLLAAKGLATVVDAHRGYLWSVPDDWSLEQAATVPVAYATAFYALVVRGRIRAGETVLIHSGAGAVGQAAISISLSYGCRVIITVGSAAKRKYLQERFPELNDSSFADSRDSNFWRTLRKLTGGRGVDVVLNSLAEDKLQASVKLLAQHGRFLEIGKYDLSNDSPLGMAAFLRNITFHGILLDALFEPGSSDWQAVYSLVSNGIRDGTVRPLEMTVFERDDIEAAFRFMAQGKHIGKVLIKVRQDDESTSLSLSAIPRTTCHPHKSYVLVGGLGGFGLELAHWLVERGARYLVLTSRAGVRTGYQDRRVRELRKAGVMVTVSTRDVNDAEEARALIREAASMCRDGVASVFNLAVVPFDGSVLVQTAEEWSAAAKPKIEGTKNLDAATRELCKDTLEWFVVFSSIVSGRGNIGQANYGYANSVMERICEIRHNDGLPAMAIQWGAIDEVGMAYTHVGGDSEATIGGSALQKMSSCLTTLDMFLCQPHAILSACVLANANRGKSGSGAASLRDVVGHILGIKDMSTVNPDLSLQDMGLDSMTGVEIKQTLERDYDINLSANEIRALTFAKLDEMQASKPQSTGDAAPPTSDAASQAPAASIHYDLQHLCPTEAVVEMNDVRAEATALAPLFVIPPIEGSVFLLNPTMSKIKSAKVYGLQCTSDAPLSSVSELASYYIKKMREIHPRGRIRLAGYSFGACVATEMVLQLQQQQTSSGDGVQSIILLDGSHSFIAAHTDRTRQQLALSGDTAGIETGVICTFISQLAFRLAPSEEAVAKVDMHKLSAELVSQADWDARVNHMISTLVSAGVTAAEAGEVLRQSVTSFYRKLYIAGDYRPSSVVSQSTRLVLVRAADNVAQVDKDYGLHAVYEGQVDVHVMQGTNESIVTADDSSSQLSHLIDALLLGGTSLVVNM